METIGKIAGIALAAGSFCVILRDHQRPAAMALSLAASIGVLLLGLSALAPVVDVLREIKALSGISGAITGPVLKVTGIGLLTRVTGGICSDAGEGTLGRAVELSGALLCLYASLPLLLGLLELVEKLLGGAK